MSNTEIIRQTPSANEIRACMRAFNEEQRASASRIAVELWEASLARRNLATPVEVVAHLVASIGGLTPSTSRQVSG